MSSSTAECSKSRCARSSIFGPLPYEILKQSSTCYASTIVQISDGPLSSSGLGAAVVGLLDSTGPAGGHRIAVWFDIARSSGRCQ